MVSARYEWLMTGHCFTGSDDYTDEARSESPDINHDDLRHNRSRGSGSADRRH